VEITETPTSQADINRNSQDRIHISKALEEVQRIAARCIGGLHLIGRLLSSSSW